MKLLLVDDDRRAAREIAHELRGEGHQVRLVHDSSTARRDFIGRAFDVIVLDTVLPDRSGLDLLGEFRARDPGTPVLLLSDTRDIEECVRGLEIGADDYLVKPVDPRELAARVRALGRRAGALGDRLLAGAVVLDCKRAEVHLNGRTVPLSPTQFRLLECFMRHPGQVLSRDQLWAHAAHDTEPSSNIVDVYVRQLRRHFGAALPLATVRGTGYRFDPPAVTIE